MLSLYSEKYNFELEVIANTDNEAFWGFSHLVFNTFKNEDICVNGINPVTKLITNYSEIEYKYYGLKHIPSLYYGYVLFDISFDYRFHDISALISLSTDNLNNGETLQWVIYFDNNQSGVWIKCGKGNNITEMKGVLTLNDRLSDIIVDTDSNDQIVYTKMYIQWNANQHQNFMKIGFGHILGQNIIASIDYDKFEFSTTNIIKYVGFARSLGSDIPDVSWKIYTNNLPSACLTETEKEKTHETQNYKQTCIENESGNTELIIYDLVTPDCIYYTSDPSDSLKYTFTITEPHDYVTANIKLFADFELNTPTASATCLADDEFIAYYAVYGDHFVIKANGSLSDGYLTFPIDGVSHLSKLRFKVTNTGPTSPAYLNCTFTINGGIYHTSNDAKYWRIIKADNNGKTIYQNVPNANELTLHILLYLNFHSRKYLELIMYRLR